MPSVTLSFSCAVGGTLEPLSTDARQSSAGRQREKMKFVLSSLLLACLCTPSSWSVSSGTHRYTSHLSVMEGDKANVSCCLMKESLHPVSKARVNWLKNDVEIKSKMNLSVNIEPSNCVTLTLSNITREDSGRYGCKVTVEIPFYEVFYGNGTVVSVTDIKNETAEVTAVAVVVPLFILTLICFCILRWKQGSAEAARVLYEVPHMDSEVADSDKHSTSSSRGSSQWCQVMVYESLDYFEHTPTKG
ncbi:uncharacterized protein LOC114851311 isoform X2 [Betta splendens]|uniref:Uncharacterized protein LOC114851311 isoform X2 n=1 Tax=Betta splendens TaxID=158456 RepID=A0A9W2Y5B1_BETSP|nr:uncharacterized protein LOC114851311 isoform X2 [Betta splendens]